MISPRIDRLLTQVDSNYASVIVAAKRARQINSYYHNLGEGTFDEFQRRVRAGEFVEHAAYSGRHYGTLRSELEQRLARGAPVVLEIEVQGARQIARTLPEAVRIFIAPPTEAALRTRLVGRGTDTAEDVEQRLQTAREELAAQKEFAHVICNDRLEDAAGELERVVREALHSGQ